MARPPWVAVAERRAAVRGGATRQQAGYPPRWKTCPKCGREALRLNDDGGCDWCATEVGAEHELRRAITDARTMMGDDAVRRVFASELRQ